MQAIEIRNYRGNYFADLFFFPMGAGEPSIFRHLVKTAHGPHTASEPSPNATLLPMRYKRELEEMLVKRMSRRRQAR